MFSLQRMLVRTHKLKSGKREIQGGNQEAHTCTFAEASVAEGKASAAGRLLISPGFPRGDLCMWTND